MSNRAMQRFADLPLRWKILIPFAVLALLYGVSGTYVFSKGTAAEARANLSARLRDGASVAVNHLEDRQVALEGFVRRVVFTQGVAEAVARRDGAGLQRLLPQLAANFGRSLVVTDARGRTLVDVRAGDGSAPRVVAGGNWRNVALIREAAARRESGILAGLVVHEGVSYLGAAAAMTKVDRETSGVVLAVDPLEGTIAHLGELTRATINFVDDAGDLLAGTTLPRRSRDVDQAIEVRGELDGRAVALLYVPVRIKGQRVGTLGVALPSASGLGALGSEAWKIAFLVIAVLAGVFVAGVWVARLIAHPLAELSESTHALQRGEFQHRVRLDRRDEVGELARSFNKMAEDLEASHEHLERRVRQRTSELAEALADLDKTNAKLERASTAKSAFLASMSHELRTPLSAILIGAEMLADEQIGRLNHEKVRNLGSKILGSGKHLLGLIDDLLDLSRIEAGRLELRTQALRLAPLLEEVDSTLRPFAERSGVSLDIPRLNGQGIHADPLRVRQVLLNLVTNAIKFTDAGGRVWIEVSSSKRSTAIAVRDTGIGISADDQGRIFEPFEQVASGQRQGVGLGLAISRRIAELHGGRLDVKSTPGKGSNFTLVLPMAAGGSPDVVRRTPGPRRKARTSTPSRRSGATRSR